MTDKYGKLFKIRTEGSSNRRFTVVSLAEGSKLIDYQIDMISRNEKSGLLPFDVRQVNGIDEIYYRTDDMLSFREYISGKGITGTDFINMLKGSVRLITDCEAMLLDSHRFLLNPDCSLVNSKGELQLMYIPVEDFEASIAESMLPFVEIFRENMGKRFEDIQISKVLLEELGKEKSNIKELDKILAKASGDVSARKVEKSTKPAVKPQTASKPLNTENRRVQEAKAEPEISVNRAVDKNPVQNMSIGKEPEIRLKGNVKNIEKTERKEDKKVGTNVAALIGIQVLLLILIGGAVFSGIARSLDITQQLGAVIILFAVDYLISRKLIGGKSKEDIGKKIDNVGKKSKPSSNIGNSEVREKINIGFSGISQPQVREKIKEEAPSQVGNSGLKINLAYHEDKTEMEESTMMLEEDSTVILDQECTEIACNRAYIVDRVSGNGEKIYIDANPFLIGRKKGVANMVCNNPNISSRHAEISLEGDEYCICDLGSTNGTMLNGNRIEPNGRYILSDGDIFTLAKSDYVFNIEE